MPTLTLPTPNEIIGSLSVAGLVGNFGRWSAQSLTTYLADSLFDPTTEEFDYAKELILAAGLDYTNLSATNYAIANKALICAIGYRLLEIDLQGQNAIAAEPNDAIHRKNYNQRMTNLFQKAGYYWKEMDITSKYYQAATVGFPATTFVQNDEIKID